MNFNEHCFCADALYRKIAGTVDTCVSKATPPYIKLFIKVKPFSCGA